MAKVREMQGTPAHIEYLKSDGKKRHPAHCLYHEGTGKKRICKNPLSPKYYQHCSSSKNCDNYEEEEKE